MPEQIRLGWRSGAPMIAILLDTYGLATAAYSLRKLSSAYTGSAIRVRRSLDNTEQNIGFNSLGELNTAALSTFTNPVPLTTPILDNYTGVTVAFSLRKLSSTYTGSVIRVRRSSDNTEQNIGFNAGGDLDTTALLSFVGVGNGFVTTWYDQSGLGRNATQTTAAAQPQIVSSGSVITKSGKPTLKFDGVNYYMSVSFNSAIKSCFTVSSTNTANYPDSSGGVFSYRANTLSFLGASTEIISGYSVGGGVIYTSNPSYGTVATLNSTSTLYTNADLKTSFAAAIASPFTNINLITIHKSDSISGVKNIGIGVDPYSVAWKLNGTISEAIAFSELQSSNNDTINATINSYYSIYAPKSSYISVWYDQSGNSRNLVQTTAEYQPTIISGGTMSTLGTKPAMYFNGSNYLFNSTSGAFRLDQRCHFYVFNETTSRNWAGVVGMPPAGGSDHQYGSILGDGAGNGNFMVNTVSTNTVVSGTKPTPYAVYTHKTENSYIYVKKNYKPFTDNTSGLHGYSANLFSTAGLYVGTRYISGGAALSQSMFGNFQEIIIYNGTQSIPYISPITSNINSYYSIYSAVSDDDAQAFIDAAVITDVTQRNAINTLVTSLKTAGVWTKMMALYPFVGGTSTSHKWNLKDPRDLNNAFRLRFNGGWTHTATGALPNGTNAFAETFLATRSWMSGLDSLHISFYSRTDVTSGGCDIGSGQTPVYFSSIYSKYNNAGTISTIASLSSDFVYIPNNNPSNAFYLVNRNNISQISLFRNSTKVSLTNLTRNYNSDMPFTISALNQGQGTVPQTSAYSSRESAFASIGYGLSDTESVAFYNAIQVFQTSLGRQV
jgi:hypothetical protein